MLGGNSYFSKTYFGQEKTTDILYKLYLESEYKEDYDVPLTVENGEILLGNLKSFYEQLCALLDKTK